MSALRDEIRAILREEIAALGSQSQPVPQPETVRIETSRDLNHFAQDLVRRMADPDFAERIARGEPMFELAAAPVPHVVTGPARTMPEVLAKTLITERDIAELDRSARSLRIARHSRLTPLARDEARRRGIRIERTET